MTLNDVIRGLKDGRLVYLSDPDCKLSSAHKTADRLEQAMGCPLGRMDFADKPCVIVWLPSVAAHPLHPGYARKEGDHARA